MRSSQAWTAAGWFATGCTGPPTMRPNWASASLSGCSGAARTRSSRRSMAPPERPRPGVVLLVGAGPGDPGLLTLRGKAALERADVVCYDYLANPALLDFAPERAERIYVGRRGRGAYAEQSEINRLLIDRKSTRLNSSHANI